MKRIYTYIIITFLIIEGCKVEDKGEDISFNLKYYSVFMEGDSVNGIELFTAREFNDSVFIVYKSIHSNFLYEFLFINDSILPFRKVELPEVCFRKENGFFESIALVNSSKILLFQDRYISVMNMKDGIINYDFYHSNEDTSLFYYQSLAQDIYYNEFSESFRTEFVRLDDVKRRKYDADTEFSIEVSLKDKKLNVLKAKYPKEFKTEKRFYTNAYMLVTNTPNYYFACSGIGNSILRWNIDGTGEVLAKSIGHKSYTEPLAYTKVDYEKKDALIRKNVRSFTYFALLYDSKNDLILRFFEKEMPEYKNELKTISSEKKIGVNILSEDFKYNVEVIIGDKDQVSRNMRLYYTSKGVISLLSVKNNVLKISLIQMNLK